MKEKRLEIRITAKEKEILEKKALKAGLTLSAFVRKSCFEKEIKVKPSEDFWELLEEIYKLFDEVPKEKQDKLKSLILQLQGIKVKPIKENTHDDFIYDIRF